LARPADSSGATFRIDSGAGQISRSATEAIRDWVRTRLARHECPQGIDFTDALPLTTTGKIMRRELRQRVRAAGRT